MPRLASITSQSLTVSGAVDLVPLIGDYQFTGVTSSNANSTGNTFYQGESVTLSYDGDFTGPIPNNPSEYTSIYWSIDGTTDDFTAVSGTATIPGATGNALTHTLEYEIDFVVEATITNAGNYTLQLREGAANGPVAATYLFNIQTFVPTGLWRDDNANPVTVQQIISPIAMQVNGVFAVNPAVPFQMRGVNSGAVTLITNIAANSGTLLELDDTGNSTAFQISEQLEII